MEKQVEKIYGFGPFRLDADGRALTRNGVETPLTPKVFDLLLTLIECRGRVVEKKELMDKLWPDSFVEEANLSQSISILRKALGENPDAPRYISTVPRRGYRFIADIEIPGNDERQRKPVDKEQNDHLEQRRRIFDKGRMWERSKERSKVFGIALATLALLILIGAYFRSTFKPHNCTALNLAQLRSEQFGAVQSEINDVSVMSKLSPDGNMIAYSAYGEGENIWVMQIGGQGIRITSGKWEDSSPIWSNDGKRIAFISNRGNQIGVWEVQSLGGSLTPLKVLAQNSSVIRSGLPILKGWSGDGAAIYYEWESNLYKLDMSSKSSKLLTQFDPKRLMPQQFTISPDERRIAYLDLRDGKIDLWWEDLVNGEPKRLTNDSNVEMYPVWLGDNKHLIYNSVLNGSPTVYAIGTDGCLAQSLTSDSDHRYISDVSVSGKRILFYEQRNQSDLFRTGIDEGESGIKDRLTSALGVEYWPDVSPDNRNIVYQCIPGEKFHWNPEKSLLFVKPITTTVPDTQPFHLASDAFEARWSPEGDRIAYLKRIDNLTNIWSINAAGGEEKQLTKSGVVIGGYTAGTTRNLFQTEDYGWSRDGREIVYCSKQGGAADLFLAATDGSGGRCLHLNSNPGLIIFSPVWSPDGKQIAYILEVPDKSRPTWRIFVTDQQSTKQIHETDDVPRLLGWSSESEIIIATVDNLAKKRVSPSTVKLLRLSSIGDRKQELPELTDAILPTILLSPDRRNISVIRAQDSVSNIFVLPVTGDKVGHLNNLTKNTDRKDLYSGLTWSADGKSVLYSRQSSWNILTIVDDKEVKGASER